MNGGRCPSLRSIPGYVLKTLEMKRVILGGFFLTLWSKDGMKSLNHRFLIFMASIGQTKSRFVKLRAGPDQYGLRAAFSIVDTLTRWDAKGESLEFV